MNAPYPATQPQPATLQDHLRAERDFWVAHWNAVKGVHPIKKHAFNT